MVVLLFFVFNYVLTCAALSYIFPKVGISGAKAWIPGVNLIEWANLIGKPKQELLWLLFPVVNLFTWTGMCVDLVRSFGKFDFWHTFLAVVCPPAIFGIVAKDNNAKYHGKILELEHNYIEQIREALERKDKIKLEKLNKQNPYKKGVIREWVEAIFFAVFAAAFIRMFLIEAYVIPSSSMEGSLLIGDYLFVSKWHYGIRTPQTVLQIPLLHNRTPYIDKESYLTSPNLPYFRLPKWQRIERNDPVVFNWPAGDSVYICPNISLVGGVIPARSFSHEDNRLGLTPSVATDFIRKNNIPLTVRPVDKRDHYIKRCVGVSGDSLEIRDRQVFINGTLLPNPSKTQYQYRVKGSIYKNQLEQLGINLEETEFDRESGTFYVMLHQAQADALKSSGAQVEILSPAKRSYHLFPHDTLHFNDWTVDNFGPIWIPKKGVTVQLSDANIALYQRIITAYEGNTLISKDGKFLINNTETNSYTFKQDYFWMMGDNRHNSEDSRYWGFVPADHVVGKPLFIWFSSGKSGIRFNRMFKGASQY